jgi:hypothetical protein
MSQEEKDKYIKQAALVNVSFSSHIAGDPSLSLAFFDHLWPYAYPRFDKIPFARKLIRSLAKDGIVNAGLLLEKAISRVGKLKRDSTVGRDFVDLSDAKSVSVRFHDGRYSADVKNIKTKQGALRILCYERNQGKFYYFIVPAKYNPKTSIEIPFDLKGNPYKQGSGWWRFQVSTFNDLSGKV